MASRDQAAQTRLARFEDAWALRRPSRWSRRSRCGSPVGEPGKRAIMVENLELTGLMKPFDAEIWFGDRVGLLGSNGSGKLHFLRLLARGRGSYLLGMWSTLRWKASSWPPVEHTGLVRLGEGGGPGGSPIPTTTRGCGGATCWRSCTAGTAAGRLGPRGVRAKLDRCSWRRRPSSASTSCPAGSGPGSSPAARLPARRYCSSTNPPAIATSSPPSSRARPRVLRGHGARGRPRSLVRPAVGPLPGVRLRRQRLCRRRARSRTSSGWSVPADRPAGGGGRVHSGQVGI